MTNETNTSHAIEINEQNDNEIIELSRVTCEEFDDSYWAKDMADYDAQHEQEDGDDMSEYADDQQDDDDDEHGFNREPREDNFRDDVDADANALASAGWGTDEDYGGDYDNGWGDW
jgi:hypothetical protein